MDLATACVPQGFLHRGERIEDLVDPHALAVDFGWIDGYRIVYHRLQHNWDAHSPDIDGVISTARGRKGIEHNMTEALRAHLRSLEGDQRDRPWLYQEVTTL